MNVRSLRHPRVRTGYTMDRGQKKTFSFLIGVGILLTLAFGFWWFLPNHIPNNFTGFPHIIDVCLFVLLTFVVWHQIVSELILWNIAKDMKHPYYMKPAPEKRVAFVTAFVPGKEPYEILDKTLAAMVDVDYPHDTWLLDEGNDAIVKNICRKYGVKHHSRNGIGEYNTATGRYKAKTKGGNLNSWYAEHGLKYDYVAQLDNDFIPRKDFLTLTLGYFNDPDVAFVGTPQIYGNTNDSLIAQGAAEQSYMFYGPIQKGLYGKDMLLLIGANHILRVEALRNIGGYVGHISEDHITGMKFYTTRKWKSVYVPEKLAIGEGPSTWESFFGQQKRWAYGLMDILFKHSPYMLPKMKKKHGINYFLLQLHYLNGLVQAFGVVLLSLFFVFGITSADMTLKPMLLLWIPLVLWQLVIMLWLQRFMVDPDTESGLYLKGKLVTIAAWPIYFMAFLELITGKQLTYKITPKGEDQKAGETPLMLFFPHFVLGSITALAMVAAIEFNRPSGILFFWALLNTITMYALVLSVVIQNYKVRSRAEQPITDLAI